MEGFKNKLGVTGPLSLRKALVEELHSLGYVEFDHVKIDNDTAIQINQSFGGNGTYVHASNAIHDADDKIFIYSLPEQWNEVLSLVAERGDIKKDIVILGYKATYKGDNVSIGCQTFSFDQVSHIEHAMRTNELTYEKVKEILDGFEE